MSVTKRMKTFFYGIVLFLVALFLVWTSNGQVLNSDKYYTSAELARQMVSAIDTEDSVEKVYNNLSKSKQIKNVDSAIFLQYVKILRGMKGSYRGKTLFRLLSANEKEMLVEHDADLKRDISDTDKFDIVELIFDDRIENLPLSRKAYFVMSVDSEGNSYLSGDWLESCINTNIYADYYFKCLEERKVNDILKLYELGLEDKVSHPNEVAARRRDIILNYCKNVVEKRVGYSYENLGNLSREELVKLINNLTDERLISLRDERLEEISQEELVDLIIRKTVSMFNTKNVNVNFVSKSFIRFTDDLKELSMDETNVQLRTIDVKLIDEQCIVDDKLPNLFNISDEEKKELAILHFKDDTPSIKLGEDVSYFGLVEKFGANLDVDINNINDENELPKQEITVILPGLVLKFSSDVLVEDTHDWSGKLVDIILVAKNDYYIGQNRDDIVKTKLKVGSKESEIYAIFPFYDETENPLNFNIDDNKVVNIDFKYFDNNILCVHVSEDSHTGEVN